MAAAVPVGAQPASASGVVPAAAAVPDEVLVGYVAEGNRTRTVSQESDEQVFEPW